MPCISKNGFFFTLLFRVLQVHCLRPESNIVNISILHTNDIHMHFVDHGGSHNACLLGAPCYGGLARFYSFVKELGLENANRTDVILVDSGGLVNTAIMNSSNGDRIAETLLGVMIGYKVMAFGASELSGGVDHLAAYIRKMPNQKFVCTNIQFSNSSENGQFLNSHCQKSVVMSHDEVNVGFLSYIRPDTLAASNPNISILNEVVSLNKEIARLKERNIQGIIVLGYSNHHLDKDILEQVPGIKVLISGHGHAMFYNGDPPNGAERDFSYPEVVETRHGQVLVAGAYFHLVYVGNLQLLFDKTGSLIKHKPSNPVMLDHSVKKSSLVTVSLTLYGLVQFLVDQRGGHVSLSPYMLDGGLLCERSECGVGSLLTDAMVNLAVQSEGLMRPGDRRWAVTGTALLESSAIGSSVMPGEITGDDLEHMVRGDTALELVLVTGEELLDLLEDMLARTARGATGSFLHFSGLRVFVAGQRVTRIHIVCTDCSEPGFEEVLPDKFYTVAMTSRLAERETAAGPAVGLLAEEMPCRRRPLPGSLLSAARQHLSRSSPLLVPAGDRLVISSSPADTVRPPILTHFAVVMLMVILFTVW